MELTLIEISGLFGSRSFLASAFANAEGYQSSLSGAPAKPLKYLPGVAEANIPAEVCRIQVAVTVIGIGEEKFGAQALMAAWIAGFTFSGTET